MRTDDANVSTDDLEAWRLLPWLANDSLRGEELESVLRHLRESAAAREELLFLSELRHAVELASSDRFEPAEARFQRLMQRIEAHESGDESRLLESREAGPREAGTERVVAVGAGTGPRVAAQGRGTAAVRRFIPWGLAAAAVILATSGLLPVLGPWGDGLEVGDAAEFRTLSEEDPAALDSAAEAPAQLRVVFDEDVSELALRNLLLSLGLEIVAGPSPRGVYSLRSAGADGDVSVQEALEALRSAPTIVFAEAATDG